MALHGDFNDSLVEETLTDMANNFFGTRIELENMIELFHSFAEALRKKETEVGARTGLLNYLLLNRQTTDDFYKSLSIECPENLLNSKLSDNTIIRSFPVALTAKGEYIKLVLMAYEGLQKICDEYNNGNDSDYSDDNESDNIPVYYKMIVNMCSLVNDKVKSVNNHMAPGDALRYVKSFNPELIGKERIIGGVGFGGNSLNQKLAFQPIDFNSLDLKKYPELPVLHKVSSEITLLCKKLYSENKRNIKKQVSDLKNYNASF
ncbi:MAG: hypothetical protein GY795_39585 [Desulfobacterales bacterium]|nr:hypothetical protein [Desulfobacterales bacterium]